MKVKRMIKSDVDTFKVGDIIKVKLTDGVKVQAMAMQQEEDGMIFCLVDCLPGEYPMNSTSTNEGGYEESDLRKKLNGEILNLFPAELKAMMTPFDNGDLLRLPTEKEIFGENYYGEYESPYVKQWKPNAEGKTRAKSLYDNYKMWCKGNGYYVCSMKKFNAELTAHPEWYADKAVTQGVLFYYGVALRQN